MDDSYTIFKDWYSSEFNEKAPARREFKSYVERKLNQQYGRGNKSGWYGYSLQHPESMDQGSSTNKNQGPGLDFSSDMTSKAPQTPRASQTLRTSQTPRAPQTPIKVPKTPVKINIKKQAD